MKKNSFIIKKNFKSSPLFIIKSFKSKKVIIKVIFIYFFIFKSFIYSHEFWIEPKEYFINKNTFLEASIKVGEMFDGINLGYYQRNFKRFDIFLNKKLKPVEGIIGDNPALNVKIDKKGLGIILHETTNNYLYYGNWNKFETFLSDKDLKEVKEIHIKKSFPREDFVEIYRRYAKSIFIVENIKGKDKLFGMETEFVLNSNELLDGNKKQTKLTLFYQNKPRKYVQVEIFEKSKNDIVKEKKIYTNEFGELLVDTKPGNSYLINSVVMREYTNNQSNYNKNSKVLWESLWASITFSIPE